MEGLVLAQQMVDPRTAWLPVVLLIVIGVGFAVGNLVLSLAIGPRRTGPGKETIYESGMIPVGDTRSRFNVRFYLVAMTFLIFDVEIVFFYPWATLYPHEPTAWLLMGIIVFTGLLLIGFLYEWGKGVFDL